MTETPPAEIKSQSIEDRIREITAPVATLQEYESEDPTVIVQRVVNRLQASRSSASILDKENEELKQIIKWLTGSLMETKAVASALMASPTPQVMLNNNDLPDRFRGWKLRAEKAVRMALPYCPAPEAPHWRTPELKPTTAAEVHSE